MKTRIVTGLIGGIILLGALWWNQWSWTIFVSLLAVIGLSELFKMGGIQPLSSLGILGYLGTIGVIVGGVSISIIFLVMFLAGAFMSLRNQKDYHIEKLALFMFGLYYIMTGFNTSIVWYEEFGKEFVLYLMVLIWISDSFAYFTGYFFGRHKMAPVLSPKKTYEGLIGGMLGTVLFAYLLNNWLGVELSLIHSLSIGVFVAVLAPLGDLFESAIKRHFGVKDSGKLLPGHGGVLDRFDAFLFVTLAYQLFYLFL